MKRSLLKNCKTMAIVAVGIFLGRGAQADTILTFSGLPQGQTGGAQIIQSFGDNAASSSTGVQVNGAGTPDIGLTWQGTGGRWDFYIDAVWSAGQLDSSHVGDLHEIIFTPTATKSVILKSFNFHPYYNNGLDYSYDWRVLDGTTVLTNGTSAFLSDATKAHPVNINYQGTNGQVLKLQLERTGGGDAGGNIAIDDIIFAQFPEPIGPAVTFLAPVQAAVSVAPEIVFNATIRDESTAVNTNSVLLSLNGTSIQPSISKTTNLTTVAYQAPGLLQSGTNRYLLRFNDNAVPANRYTNELLFVVAAYTNLLLPPPIVFENFDSTIEGGLPTGWSQTNYTDMSLSDTSRNFTNLDSATFATWTVIDAPRFTNEFYTYSSPTNTTLDYQRVLSVNPSNVVNGQFVRNLATGRLVFGNSGYRLGASQVMYLFSPDFNLTGRSNVHLSYHSLWEQNQDSIGAVEYSINEGQTWLPVVYMLDRPDILLDANTNVDAQATFSTIGQGIAFYTDPADGQEKGGFYGAFIGVQESQWGTLAPYISAREDDNPIESKRVEIFRLPLADNQPKVRFRFAHAGTDSWYFGMDDFGLYSLGATVQLPSLTIRRVGNDVIISWPSDAVGFTLDSSPTLTPPSWTQVGTGINNSMTLPVTSGNRFFRLRK